MNFSFSTREHDGHAMMFSPWKKFGGTERKRSCSMSLISSRPTAISLPLSSNGSVNETRNVSPIPLPGGLNTMISGIGVFYPDRRPTQRVGIVADIEARPTIAGVRQGRDEVLEVALRQILGDGVPRKEIERMARH